MKKIIASLLLLLSVGYANATGFNYYGSTIAVRAIQGLAFNDGTTLNSASGMSRDAGLVFSSGPVDGNRVTALAIEDSNYYQFEIWGDILENANNNLTSCRLTFSTGVQSSTWTFTACGPGIQCAISIGSIKITNHLQNNFQTGIIHIEGSYSEVTGSPYDTVVSSAVISEHLVGGPNPWNSVALICDNTGGAAEVFKGGQYLRISRYRR